MAKIIQTEKHCISKTTEMRLFFGNFIIVNYFSRILSIIVVFLSLIDVVQANSAAAANHTETTAISNCVDGVIIPIWLVFIFI